MKKIYTFYGNGLKEIFENFSFENEINITIEIVNGYLFSEYNSTIGDYIGAYKANKYIIKIDSTEEKINLFYNNFKEYGSYIHFQEKLTFGQKFDKFIGL